MRQHLLTLFLLLSLSALGQTRPSANADGTLRQCVVYDLAGDAFLVTKGPGRRTQRDTIHVGDTLQATQVLSIPERNAIKLVDEANRKMYVLSGPANGSLTSLAASPQTETKSLSATYLNYIRRTMFSKRKANVRDTEVATTIFRSDADSLIVGLDSLQSVVDSLEDVIQVLRTDSLRHDSTPQPARQP